MICVFTPPANARETFLSHIALIVVTVVVDAVVVRRPVRESHFSGLTRQAGWHICWMVIMGGDSLPANDVASTS